MSAGGLRFKRRGLTEPGPSAISDRAYCGHGFQIYTLDEGRNAIQFLSFIAQRSTWRPRRAPSSRRDNDPGPGWPKAKKAAKAAVATATTCGRSSRPGTSSDFSFAAGERSF